MVIYLLIYSTYFSILSIGLGRKNKRRWIAGATLPMLALVWLRGMVGIDLPMYVQSIDSILQNGGYTFIFEPGFEYLILAIGILTSDALLVTKVVSTITTTLLLISKWRTNAAYQVLGLGIIPYFYLDMTMNGLRYGLAFSIVLLSINSLLRMQRFRYASSAILSASIQVSSFYLSALLQALFNPSWKYLLLIVPITIAMIFFGLDYFTQKALINVELSKPGITAGIAPLLLSLIILAANWTDKLTKQNYQRTLLVLLLLTLGTYGVTQFSYAGLRLQQLNYFLVLLFTIYANERMQKGSSKWLLYSLILVAIMGSAFRLNNFRYDVDVGDAPFIPYKLFWQS